VAAARQVNHGNGFYERFFGPSDGPGIVQPDGQPLLPLTQEAMDLYQAFLVSYGHAGFLSTNGAKYPTAGYLTHPASAQTYFMTNALQSLYYGSEIAAIRYRVGGEFQTFEKVISESETLDTFRHVPLRLDFKNGLKIIVNHGDTPLSITEGGLDYVLPAKSGWYAEMGNGWLVAFSAIPPGTGGQRIDYCLATGQYEYFNGRGQVAGYGGISTDAKLSKWTVTPTSLTVTEDAAGALATEYGPIPDLAEVLILPEKVRLEAGEKVGLKAVAVCTNGGLLDLSTVLDWYSTDPGTASVNENGVVTANAAGDALILAVGQGGALISEVCTIRVN
jgi:hypothetical protein